MEPVVRLEHVGSRPLAVVRRRASAGELGAVVPAACGVVWAAVKAAGLAGAGRLVAVYLDGVINLEVGVELDAPFAGHGEVVGSATQAGEVAHTTHYGPYGGLAAAHKAVRRWCAAHGRTPAGPSWEVYGHWQDDWNRDPGLITTQVYYLLAAAETGPALVGN